jgi:hypothetical protein
MLEFAVQQQILYAIQTACSTIQETAEAWKSVAEQQMRPEPTTPPAGFPPLTDPMILSGKAWARAVTAIREAIAEYERDPRTGSEAYVQGLQFALNRIKQHSEAM